NFGATLYWAITGQNYPTVMPSKKRNGIDLAGPRDVTPPEQINPNVPTALSWLVLDSCRPNPQDRPANMGEVIRRLELAQHVLDKNQATLTGPAIRGKRGPMQPASAPALAAVASSDDSFDVPDHRSRDLVDDAFDSVLNDLPDDTSDNAPGKVVGDISDELTIDVPTDLLPDAPPDDESAQ
ncbi:MAG: hypothetical protein FWC56_05215, partial [Phycisphaerae bacterium]|nr:hypothetical protein [Phycisphaerae bacterium]